MFFNVCLHLRSFPLLADWRKSDRSVDGEPQGNWRWNSNSRDPVASSRATESTAWNPEFKTVGYMLWLPIIQSCFTLGTRNVSCLASSFGLYGDLCKAIDVSARGLSRNIPLRAPFGTQGRLAIPFVHIFVIKERYSILKQTFATLHRSCARYNFFVFSRTLTSVRAKWARHPRFFYLYTSSRRYLNGK